MRNEQIKFNVPKLFVRVNKRGYYKQGTKCDLHCHDEIEFLIVYDGEYTVGVDGTEYSVKAGEIAFINSGVPHTTLTPVRAESSLIQFKELDYINSELYAEIKYSKALISAANPPIVILKDSDISASLEEVLEETDKNEPASDFFIKSAIHKTLGHLYRKGILTDPSELLDMKSIQKVMPVMTYVNEHFDEDISLSQVSEMLNFDESYFCRLFKSATGTTFTEYLNLVRVRKAEKLLKKTSNSILEISEAVGFSSVSYFNRIFKKNRHLSPRAYRAVLYENI